MQEGNIPHRLERVMTIWPALRLKIARLPERRARAHPIQFMGARLKYNIVRY